MSTVVVAVPAHDEEDEIEACLAHVAAAARVALAAGKVDRVVVAVAVHRSSDRTEARARRALARADHVTGHVVVDTVSTSVGEVRGRLLAGVAAALDPPASAWVFNTDADSRVPADWVRHTLAQAARSRCDAVAGLVVLDGWEAPRDARRAYRAILRRGMGPGGHRHVYGANLAVRWGAYVDVGGFPATSSEDHALVARLREAGYPVLASLEPLVTISAREPGRCEDGLAALLARLRQPSPG